MFTSGSTGRPKAVTVTQGGIAALLEAVRPMLALGPEDRFVAVSTFTFDIALVELLAPVLAGGCVIVADSEHTLDAALLRELLVSPRGPPRCRRRRPAGGCWSTPVASRPASGCG